MPKQLKRRLHVDDDADDAFPPTRARPMQQNGTGDSLEDDVPLTAAAQQPPTARKKLRRADEPAVSGAAREQRQDGRAQRAAAVAARTPAEGMCILRSDVATTMTTPVCYSKWLRRCWQGAASTASIAYVSTSGQVLTAAVGLGSTGSYASPAIRCVRLA